MNEEIKKRIDELKEVVISLYRSAGSLDQQIQELEMEIFGRKDTDRLLLLAMAENQRNYRKSLKTCCEYDILDEKEEKSWNEIINILREGS